MVRRAGPDCAASSFMHSDFIKAGPTVGAVGLAVGCTVGCLVGILVGGEGVGGVGGISGVGGVGNIVVGRFVVGWGVG